MKAISKLPIGPINHTAQLIKKDTCHLTWTSGRVTRGNDGGAELFVEHI